MTVPISFIYLFIWDLKLSFCVAHEALKLAVLRAET